MGGFSYVEDVDIRTTRMGLSLAVATVLLLQWVLEENVLSSKIL